MSSHEEAMRIHQEQIQAVLKAEQDLIALQKRKFESENGINPAQEHRPEPPHYHEHHHQHEEQHHQPEPAHHHHGEQQPQAASHHNEPQFQLRKLIVELLEARNLPNNDLLGNIDPYVLLLAGPERHQSTTFKNAGTNPNFNNFQIHLPLQHDVDRVDFELWNKNKLVSDSILGRGSFHINNTKLRSGEGCDVWVPLLQDGLKPAGEVHVKFMPSQ